MPVQVIPQARQGHAPWSASAAKYGSVGSATKITAQQLVKIVDGCLPFSAPSTNVIDMAAGTGSQTLTLLDHFPKTRVLAAEISDKMLGELRTTLKQNQNQQPEKWGSTEVDIRFVDMQDPCRDHPELNGAFTHCLNAFALQIVFDAQGTLDGAYQLLRPGIGAVAAVAIWDFTRHCDPHAIWEEAAAAVDPKYEPPRRNITNNIMGVEDVEAGMQKAGFEDVESEIVTCPWPDGFTEWFFEGQNPFALERIASWPRDVRPIREAIEQIVQERIASGRGIWVDTGVTLGTKP